MEQSIDPAQMVISAMKDRNIPPKREEIASAFCDNVDSAKNTDWVKTHLNPDTLLSQEELSLYSKLESSGALPGIFYHPDFDATRPFLDEDLRKAIESLNESTAEIQRQTEVLKSQYEVLSKQLKQDEERWSKQNRDVERLRQKHEAGRQNTAAASDDITLDLETNLKNEVENATMDGKRILSTLTTRLKEDDRTLVDLEKLAADVKCTDNDASILKQTSQLSTVLARYVSEEIYHRLDRMYLERVLTSGDVKPYQSTDLDDNCDEFLRGLEGELDSLFPEIDILAEISTKQQYVEPILKELQNHHGKLRIASHQKLDYILGMVTGMTASLEDMTTSLQDRESFCATLEDFASAYRSEVGDQTLDPASSRRETMRRFSTLPASMISLPGKRAGPFPESQALAGLLRRIGISFESLFRSDEDEAAVNILLRERQHMLDKLRNYGVASDSPLVAELLPTDRATRLLSSSLNADSEFKPSLSSVGYERSLTDLESKLGQIQKGMERLNCDVVYQPDKNQEKFLERWG